MCKSKVVMPAVICFGDRFGIWFERCWRRCLVSWRIMFERNLALLYCQCGHLEQLAQTPIPTFWNWISCWHTFGQGHAAQILHGSSYHSSTCHRKIEPQQFHDAWDSPRTKNWYNSFNVWQCRWRGHCIGTIPWRCPQKNEFLKNIWLFKRCKATYHPWNGVSYVHAALDLKLV